MKNKKLFIVFISLIFLFSFSCLAGSKCPYCGSYDYFLDIVPATCQKSGHREFECYECGNCSYKIYPIIDHDFIESSRVEPTYTSDGFQYLNCSMCGTEKTVIIPMLVCPDHHYIETDRVEPTENNSGAITYQCTICGDSYYSELDYVNPVPPDTSSLAKTVFNGVWGLTDIYVPGFNFTIRQMWLGVVICSISVMIIKHLFNFGGSGVSSRTGSTNKPKISDNRKRDEY